MCVIFNKKDIRIKHLSRLAQSFMWDCLLVQLCLLIFQANCFIVCSMSTSIFLQYTGLLTKNTSQWSYGYSTTASVFILPFMAMPLVIATSFPIGHNCFLLCSTLFLYVDSLVLYMILAFAVMHPPGLLPVCLLFMCILVYLSMC